MQRKKYKRNFLKQVIVRVDFESPLLFSSSGLNKVILDEAKKEFPIAEEKRFIGKEFLIGSNTPYKERAVEKKEWLFYGKDREKKLTISSDFMHISYNKYENYQKLCCDFLSISNIIFKSFLNIQIKRLGLRYIDSIEIPEENPFEWDKYIKSELNSGLALFNNKEMLSRFFHVLELNFGEDMLRFQYGMFNPDYPAPIRKKTYTLDFDMYTRRILNYAEVEETLNRFHDKASEYFEKVITNNLRKIMES